MPCSSRTRRLLLALLGFGLLAVMAGGPVARARQQQDAPDGDARRQFQRWLEQERADMSSYLTEQNRQFAAFLREAWREYDLATGKVRDRTPKPDVKPRAPDREPLPQPDTTRTTPPLPPAAPPPPPPPLPPAPTATHAVNYLGLDYSLPLDEWLQLLPAHEPGPEATADAWLRLNAIDSAPLRDALARQARERRLADWALFGLLEATAHAAYPDDPSRQALFHWFLGLRAGLDVRLAYARPGYAVLYASTQTVYQVEFVMHDGRAYYVHDPTGRFRDAGRLRSYDGQPPLATRPLALDLSRLPVTAADPVRRRLAWELDGNTLEAEIVLDGHLVAFLGTVPQTRLGSHFGAALSTPALRSLRDALAPHLSGRDEVGRVALLLRFVQSALAYATDQEQFGREDYLYPDESLFYPRCDCEDRAALFAALVREFVGLEVVGLDYPGHVAAAVALPRDVRGDRFQLRGRDFTVCDPTYLGAGPGRSMPIPGAARPSIIEAGV